MPQLPPPAAPPMQELEPLSAAAKWKATAVINMLERRIGEAGRRLDTGRPAFLTCPVTQSGDSRKQSERDRRKSELVGRDRFPECGGCKEGARRGVKETRRGSGGNFFVPEGGMRLGWSGG